MRQEDRFDSDCVKERRVAAAKSLLAKVNMKEAEDVLDFFESVGLLVRLKALDLETVYGSFFHWINLYWNAAREHIEARRQKCKALWTDFEGLYRKVIEIERRKDSSSDGLAPTPDAIKKDLEDERNLLGA